jgi:hypothetical protein
MRLQQRAEIRERIPLAHGQIAHHRIHNGRARAEVKHRPIAAMDRLDVADDPFIEPLLAEGVGRIVVPKGE